MSIEQLRSLSEWVLEYPDDYDSNFQIAYEKGQNSKQQYVVKKLEFSTMPQLQDQHKKVTRALDGVSKQTARNCEFPHYYHIQDTAPLILTYLIPKQEKSLLDDIMKRRRQKDYYSAADLKYIIKQTYQTLNDIINNRVQPIPHTNIKPSNILITQQGENKISEIQMNTQKTTQCYIAPEISFDESLVGKSMIINDMRSQLAQDAYSLGVTYFMLATLSSEEEMLDYLGSSRESVDRFQKQKNDLEKKYGRELSALITSMMNTFSRRLFINIQQNSQYNQYLLSHNNFEGGNDNVQIDPKTKEKYENIFKKMGRNAKKFKVKVRDHLKEQGYPSYNKFNNTIKSRDLKDFIVKKLDVDFSMDDFSAITELLDPYRQDTFDLTQMFEFIESQNFDEDDDEGVDDYLRQSLLKSRPLTDRDKKDKDIIQYLQDSSVYLQQKGVDLEKEFLHLDRGNGTVKELDFKQILREKGANVSSPAIMNNIVSRYRSRDGDVDYRFFVAEMNSYYKVKDTELDDIRDKSFKAILEKHKTIDNFFNTYSKGQVMKYEQFNKFFNKHDINVPPKVKESFFRSMDFQSKGMVTKHHIYKEFNQIILTMFKTQIINLSSQLMRGRVTLEEKLKKYQKQGYIEQDDLYYSFSSIDSIMKDEHVDFLLGYFRQTPTGSDTRIDCRQFRLNVLRLAQKLKIGDNTEYFESKSDKSSDNYSQQNDPEFQVLSSDVREMKDQIKMVARLVDPDETYSYFGVSVEQDKLMDLKDFQIVVEFFVQVDNRQNLSKLYDNYFSRQESKVSTTQFLKEMGVEIEDARFKNAKNAVAFDKNLFKKYKELVQAISEKIMKKRFKSDRLFDQKKMLITEFKSVFRSIDFDTSAYRDQFSDLVNDLTLDRKYIDSKVFLEMLDNFSSNSNYNEELYIQIYWFTKIYQVLQKQEDTENKLAIKAQENNSQIPHSTFKRIMTSDLGFSDLKNFDRFVESISDYKKDLVNYNKFEDGLSSERKAQKLKQKINDAVKGLNYNLDDFFKKYETDDNINKKGFQNIIKDLKIPTSEEENDYCFNKVDSSHDGVISLLEFKIFMMEIDEDVQDKYVSPFIKSIQKGISDRHKDPQEAFSKYIDARKISLQDFKQVCEDNRIDTERNYGTQKAIKVLSNDSNYIDWDIFMNAWNQYIDQDLQDDLKKSYDKRTEDRVYDFGRQIRYIMNQQKIPFKTIYKMQDKYKREIKVSELQDFVRIDLKLHREKNYDFFFTFLDGKDCSRNYVSVDNLEKYIDFYEKQKAEWQINEEQQENIKQWQKFLRRNRSEFEKEIKQSRRFYPDNGTATFDCFQDTLNTMNKVAKKFYDVSEKEVRDAVIEKDSKTGDRVDVKKFLNKIEDEHDLVKEMERRKTIQQNNNLHKERKLAAPLPPPPPKYDKYSDSDSDDYYYKSKNKHRDDSRNRRDRSNSSERGRRKSEYKDNRRKSKYPDRDRRDRDSSEDMDDKRYKPKKYDKYDDSGDDRRKSKRHDKNDKYYRSFQEKSSEKKKKKHKRQHSYHSDSESFCSSSSQSSSSSEEDIKGVKKYKSWRREQRKHRDSQIRKSDVQEMKEKFVDLAKEYCKRKEISTNTLFKRFDQDNNNGAISIVEFREGFSWFDPDEEILRGSVKDNKKKLQLLFDALDADSDFSLSLHEFQNAILGDEAIDERPLLNKIRRNVDTEDLMREFKNIDKNNDGMIDFKEFKHEFGDLFNNKISQIEKLFQMYSDSNQKMSYEQFVELLEEDHLNIKKIKRKIDETVQKYSLRDEQELFEKHTSGKKNMDKTSLKFLLKDCGFHFDYNMIDELFGHIDKNHDGTIDFREFQEILMGKKNALGGNSDNVMRKLRRRIVEKKNLNINHALKLCANRSTNSQYILFKDFQQMLVYLEFGLSYPEMETIFEENCLGGSNYRGEKQLDYKQFYKRLLSADYDIQHIINNIKEAFNIRRVGDEEISFRNFSKKSKQEQIREPVINIRNFDNLLHQCDMDLTLPELRDAFNRFDLHNVGYLVAEDYKSILFSSHSSDWNQQYNFLLMQGHHYNPEASKKDRRQDVNSKEYYNFGIKNRSNIRSMDNSASNAYKSAYNNDRLELKKEDSRDNPYYNKSNNTQYGDRDKGGRSNYNNNNDYYGNKSRENSDYDDDPYSRKKTNNNDRNRPRTPDRYSQEGILEWIGYQAENYANAHPLSIFGMFTQPTNYYETQKKNREKMQNQSQRGGGYGRTSSVQFADQFNQDEQAFKLQDEQQMDQIFQELKIQTASKHDSRNFFADNENRATRDVDFLELCIKVEKIIAEKQNNDYDNNSQKSDVQRSVEFFKEGILQLMRYQGKNANDFFITVIQRIEPGYMPRQWDNPDPWGRECIEYINKTYNFLDYSRRDHLDMVVKYFANPSRFNPNERVYKNAQSYGQQQQEIHLRSFCQAIGVEATGFAPYYIPKNIQKKDTLTQRAENFEDVMRKIAQISQMVPGMNILDIFIKADDSNNFDFHFESPGQLMKLINYYRIRVDEYLLNSAWDQLAYIDNKPQRGNYGSQPQRKLNFMNLVRQLQNPSTSWYTILIQMMIANNWNLDQLFFIVLAKGDQNQVQQMMNQQYSGGQNYGGQQGGYGNQYGNNYGNQGYGGYNQQQQQEFRWNLSEIQFINQGLNLQSDELEMQIVYNSWNPDGRGITLDYLSFIYKDICSRQSDPRELVSKYQQRAQQQLDNLNFCLNNMTKLQQEQQQYQDNMHNQERNSRQDQYGKRQTQSEDYDYMRSMNQKESQKRQVGNLTQSVIVENDEESYMDSQYQKKNQTHDQWNRNDKYGNNDNNRQEPIKQSPQEIEKQRQENDREMQKHFQVMKDELRDLMNERGVQPFEDEGHYDQTVNERGFINASYQLGIRITDIYKKFARHMTTQDSFNGIKLKDLYKQIGVNPSMLPNKNAGMRQSIQVDHQLPPEAFGITKKKRQSNFNVNKQKAMRSTDIIRRGYQTYDLLQEEFFPDHGKILLELDDFTEKALKNIDADGAENLFYHMDNNQSGTISLSEFKLNFQQDKDSRDNKKKKKQIYKAPPRIEKEIEELFKEIDGDGSGAIDKGELKVLLQSFGINVDHTEIDTYMNKIDSSKDGKIDYQEFRQYIIDRMLSDLMTCEDILDDLISEFRIADIHGSGCLNKEQIYQVFKNLKIELTQDELNDLFDEIDKDRNQTVDVDELTFFINNNNQNLSGNVLCAVLNIRSSRKLSLKDLKATFENMPSNFRSSFTRAKHQKCQYLPSKVFKPVKQAMNYYEDLPMCQPLKYSPDDCHLGKDSSKEEFLIEMKLDRATGVPIPDEQQIPRDNLRTRVLYITLFNQQKTQFYGSTCRVFGNWDENYEDRWTFAQKNVYDAQNILIRLNDMDDKSKTEIQVLFELSVHYYTKSKGQTQTDLEMSCSFGVIDLKDLLEPGRKSVTLKGGEPYKVLDIKDDDVRTKRTGFGYIVKKISKKITSTLQFDVLQMNQNTQTELQKMPSRSIINKNALPLFATYREYLACVHRFNPEKNLETDLVIVNFLKAIDCPDVYWKLIDFWKDKLLHFFAKAPLTDIREKFEQAMRHIYLLFCQKNFNFMHSDPSASCYCHPLQSERDKLLRQCFEDIESITKMRDTLVLKLSVQNTTAFSIQEFMEDDEDDNLFMDNVKMKLHGKITDTDVVNH